MHKHNNKYDYKPIPKETKANGKRTYMLEDGSGVPSVTTILSATKSKKSIKALSGWRKRVGEKEATRVVTKAVNIGNQLHDNLEHYLRDGQEPEGPVLVKLMTNIMIKHGLKNLDEWWGLECSLYSTGLYAGTADLTGVYKGIPCIGDFKNSRKKKKLEWIDDYRCQLAAYSLAHNEMFGTNIKSGVILMVTRACEFEEFHITGDLYKESVDMWLRRLEDYYLK